MKYYLFDFGISAISMVRKSMQDNVMTPLHINLVVCLCSLSIGFGVSQIAVANEVRGHSKEITALAKVDEGLSKLNEITNNRIDRIAALVEEYTKQSSTEISKLIEQNTKLITLLELQRRN